jgi:hypothetical protein
MMVDTVKGPNQAANFSIMMEYTPESCHCHSVNSVEKSIDGCWKPVIICTHNSLIVSLQKPPLPLKWKVFVRLYLILFYIERGLHSRTEIGKREINGSTVLVHSIGAVGNRILQYSAVCLSPPSS